MSEGAIMRISLDEALKAKGQGKTDWKRLALEEEAGEEERQRVVAEEGAGGRRSPLPVQHRGHRCSTPRATK